MKNPTTLLSSAQGDSRRAGPMSISRVIGILEHLTNDQSPTSLSDISRLLEAPKTSLLSILNELQSLGFVRKDEAGRYLLAARAFRLASRMSASGSLARSVRTALVDIGRELEATVSLGYLDVASHTLIYADRYGDSSAVRYRVKFGPATHVHSRATGKMLIALQLEDSWPSWFGPEPYAKVTDRTHRRMSTLSPELKEARRALVAYTHSEQYEDIAGCSVPVFGADARAAAGIGLLMIGESMERQRERVLTALRKAAGSLADELKLRNITVDNIGSHL